MRALFLSLLVALGAGSEAGPQTAPQWETIEIPFEIRPRAENPYLSVDGHVLFQHSSGEHVRRPLFWDGADRFAVRFASTRSEGRWEWELSLPEGLETTSARRGAVEAAPATGTTRFSRHGFWTVPRGARQMIHRDGTSVILVGDTAWALPWRATPEQVRRYAADRRDKGFNAALLMTIQPDMGAEGPPDREADGGFAVAFEDLPTGHIRELNVDYFKYFDTLHAVLVEHGIAPVFQPVFHGYGWKGLRTAGNVIPPDEYARFCRYLVARYGAAPAIWLVGGDGIGDAPGIGPGGEAIEDWDDYEQPTGMHYAPHGKTDSFQDAAWLDFQWAQTGHNGEHLPEVALAVYRQKPVKAAANGEPSYENMGAPGRAAGWWQGHEAWSNLCAGGSMGVVYGAGSLWNWVLHPGEPGHQDWTLAKGKAWYDALEFEGSRYVGNVGRILNAYATHGAEPNWRLVPPRRALHRPGKLFVLYLSQGGSTWTPYVDQLPRRYRIYDPRTAALITEGRLAEDASGSPLIDTGSTDPRVIVFYEPEAEQASP
ncbi:MAG: DUF4038 domain-containing protein [Acidobacteriota bacterium]|jgi:hypothetical protein